MTGSGDEISPAPSAAVMDRLHAALADLAHIVGEPHTVAPLEGGLTNFNFKVATADRTVVVRLSSSDGDLLAIDRDAEHSNSLRAATSGAAPAVVAYLPEHHALVVEWVEGRTLAAERPAGRRHARPGGRGLPGAARGRAVRGRLRHVRDPAALPGDRPGARLPAAGALPRPDAAGGAHRRRPRRTPGAHRARATTTCWRPTSSTTASGCGSSTTSTAATTTRASSSATSGRSPSCPSTTSRSSSTATTAGTCGTRSPGRGCSA